MNLSLRRHFARGRSHGSQPFRLRHFKPLLNLGGLGEQFLGVAEFDGPHPRGALRDRCDRSWTGGCLSFVTFGVYQ